MSAKASNAGERMVTLDVSLLGREYKVACKADEEAELKDAVEFLELRMKAIRDGSKSSSVERVAVMAALNLAHDFQRGQVTPTAGEAGGSSADVADLAAARRRIASMQSALDQVLPGKEKLF